MLARQLPNAMRGLLAAVVHLLNHFDGYVQKVKVISSLVQKCLVD
jgi:hypothetical protein